MRGVRLVTQGDQTSGYLVGPEGMLAHLTMMRAPRFKAFLEIAPGDSPQAAEFCNWFIEAVRDAFKIRSAPIPLNRPGSQPDGDAGTVQPNGNGHKGKKITEIFVEGEPPPEEAVKASEVYALGVYVLKWLRKDPTIPRKILVAKAAIHFERPVTENQVDYALQKFGTSVRRFREEYERAGKIPGNNF